MTKRIIKAVHIDPVTRTVLSTMEAREDLILLGPTMIEVDTVPEDITGLRLSEELTYEVDPDRVISRDQVNEERDRRIDAGFAFGAYWLQTRPEDRENIAGATQFATLAVMAGTGVASFYRWADPNTDFEWIMMDNQTVLIDAPTMIEIGKMVANHKQVHIFAAKALKDMTLIPVDYTNDIYWP